MKAFIEGGFTLKPVHNMAWTYSHDCLPCNKDYLNRLNEKLKTKFKNTSKVSYNDINKFILYLRKGVYPYEYMDDWEKFNETTLPKKERIL